MNEKKTSFKRFFRFGLRSFFVVTTTFCVWFGIVKTQANSQSEIVEMVQSTGGHCRYDFEVDRLWLLFVDLGSLPVSVVVKNTQSELSAPFTASKPYTCRPYAQSHSRNELTGTE